MVASNNFEEPNLSYVRVNQSTSPGTGESIKCHITKSLSPSDAVVINSQLLHKSMVEQPLPPQIATTTFWKPDHLYSEQEKAESAYKFERWERLPRVTATKQFLPKKIVFSTGSSKRPLEESYSTSDNQSASKKPKLAEDVETLRQRTVALEQANKQLFNKNRELEQRMELMARIMKDPRKLSMLVERLNSINKKAPTVTPSSTSTETIRA